MKQPLLALLSLFVAAGCAPLNVQTERCPTRQITTMPRVPAGVGTLSFWSQKWGDEAKKVLLSHREITALNSTNAIRPWAYQDVTSAAIGNQQRVGIELEERRVWIKQRVDSGRYIESKPGSLKRMAATIQSASLSDELRILTARTDLRCLPSQQKLIAPASSPTFDRNQCSGLAVGSVVRVLRKAAPWFYVHGAHSVGWITKPRWTPPISASKAREFRDDVPRMVFTGTTASQGEALDGRLGDNFPIDIMSDGEGGIPLIVPTASGLASRQVAPRTGLEQGWLPFTAGNVLRLAFSELNRGYGWGESGGLTDCSRLLLDVFRAFGIRLGRHSSEQANSGTTTKKIGQLSSPEKLTTLRSFAKKGILFLYMPGHIMLYLGEHEGQHFAVSAIHDFKSQCPHRKADGQVQIRRVTVSDLQVGRGTAKGSFLERLTRLTLFGPSTVEQLIE